MRAYRFVLPLALLVSPVGVEAQAAPRQVAPVGVRQLRRYSLNDSRSPIGVNATADGLVELSFDGPSEGNLVHPLGGRPLHEFFEPGDVLEWVNSVDALVAWLAKGTASEEPPAPALGRTGGVRLVAKARVTEGGRRNAWFETTGCGVQVSGADLGPVGVAATAALFRRAALEARSAGIPHHDDPVWYEHAVGCAARPRIENMPPAFPPVPAGELRPHEEIVQFVVDAGGLIEPGSEQFLPSSDPRFAAEIRSVLPTWRFTPASRLGFPVRQLVHVTVGFMPPIVLEPGPQYCPRDDLKGIVARQVPRAGAPIAGAPFLRDVAAAFAWDPVADPLHGSTIRFTYARSRTVSGLRVQAGYVEPGVAVEARRNIEGFVAGRLPELWPAFPGESIELEVEFGLRCERLFSTLATNEIASILPQGDGMVRLANVPEADGRFMMEGQGGQHDVVTAMVLRRFVDTAAVLIPSMDTAPRHRGNEALEYEPRAPMLGQPDGTGLHMWLTSYGWFRASMGCESQARFMEVSASQVAAFRRAALAATGRTPIQPRWAARGDLPFGEHEVACVATPLRGNRPPAQPAGNESSASTEVLVTLTVNREGEVEPASIETLPVADSVARQLVVAAVKAWRFRPAMRGGMPVRAEAHLSFVVRPADADAVVLAANPVRPASDTLRRTVFFKPNAPADRPQAVAGEQAWADAMAAMKPWVDRARETWPEARARFLRGLPREYDFFVTARLTDALRRTEQVFVRVERIEGFTIHGRIQSEIQFVTGWRRGDAYSMRDSELIDWTIVHPDGTEEGNLVGKFLDTYRPRRKD